MGTPQQKICCPTGEPPLPELEGCGSTNVEWDRSEGYDCLDCGLFFEAAPPTPAEDEITDYQCLKCGASLYWHSSTYYCLECQTEHWWCNGCDLVKLVSDFNGEDLGYCDNCILERKSNDTTGCVS